MQMPGNDELPAWTATDVLNQFVPRGSLRSSTALKYPYPNGGQCLHGALLQYLDSDEVKRLRLCQTNFLLQGEQPYPQVYE